MAHIYISNTSAYKGKKIDIIFSEPYDIPQDETAVIFDEYFKLINQPIEFNFQINSSSNFQIYL